MAEGFDVGLGVAFEDAGNGSGLRGTGGELAKEAGGDERVVHGAEFALDEAEAVEAGLGLFGGEEFEGVAEAFGGEAEGVELGGVGGSGGGVAGAEEVLDCGG